ncbi:MAG: retron system putative HNH endonuclease [Clostridia bacterium]
MLDIIKSIEPDVMKKFKKHNNPKSWDDYKGDIKQPIKEYILENEQFHSCAYCEVKIEDIHKAHIEHIKPKSKQEFSNLFQDYDNLIVSCNTAKHCGNAKGDKYSNLFINPVIDNPEDFLTYNLADGKIISKNPDPYIVSRVNETIDTLNLNSKALVNARKHYILELQYYDENDLDIMLSNHDRFYTLIKCFKQQNF